MKKLAPQIVVERFLRDSLNTSKLNSYERILLVMLASYTGNNVNCWPSHLTLSKVCGMSTDSVKRYLKSLEEKKLIKILRYMGINNHYELTIPYAISTQGLQHLEANSTTNQVPTAFTPSADTAPNNISNNITNYIKGSTEENSRLNPDNSLLKAITDSYHAILPMCPKSKRWNKRRKGYLHQLIIEDPECAKPEYWLQYFEHVKESSWLTGQISRQDGQLPFLPNLEWLIKPDNFLNISEGIYHRR